MKHGYLIEYGKNEKNYPQIQDQNYPNFQPKIKYYEPFLRGQRLIPPKKASWDEVRNTVLYGNREPGWFLHAHVYRNLERVLGHEHFEMTDLFEHKLCEYDTSTADEIFWGLAMGLYHEDGFYDPKYFFPLMNMMKFDGVLSQAVRFNRKVDFYFDRAVGLANTFMNAGTLTNELLSFFKDNSIEEIKVESPAPGLGVPDISCNNPEGIGFNIDLKFTRMPIEEYKRSDYYSKKVGSITPSGSAKEVNIIAICASDQVELVVV